MTRERRIEANARERQRVQAITEVYETLRGVIPVEDKCSKLSKLSIIRIATGKNHAFKKGLNDFVFIRRCSLISHLAFLVQHLNESFHIQESFILSVCISLYQEHPL